MLKIPRTRNFYYSNFIYSLIAFFAFLTFIAVSNASAKTITGGAAVESFLESTSNQVFLKSLTQATIKVYAEPQSVDAVASRSEKNTNQRFIEKIKIFFGFSNEPASLGNYPTTSVALSGNTIVTPDAAPTGITGISISTNTNFKGNLEIDPETGIVRVTNAYPSGTFPVFVVASTVAGTTTKSFDITVNLDTSCANPSFTSPTLFSVVGSPISLAVGDFNRDSKQDIITTNFNGNTVSIRLGNGSGGFSSTSNVAVGVNPRAVAVGDFNRDGKQDAAVVNSGSNDVSILIGNGSGSFSLRPQISVGTSPYNVVVGDFDNDGKQDLAVPITTTNNISILMGMGNGDFEPAQNFSGVTSPRNIAIGDFNEDGNQDLIAITSGTTPGRIFLGNGDGTFALGIDLPAATGNGLVTGDFNGDGKHDIAVANRSRGPRELAIFLGNGSGGFSPPSWYFIGGPDNILSAAAGDFNRDGLQDIATSSFDSLNPAAEYSIMIGTGAGAFANAGNYNLANTANALAVGDFNSDGRQDIATVMSISDNFTVSTGTCGTPTPTPTPTGSPTPTPTPTPTATPTPTPNPAAIAGGLDTTYVAGVSGRGGNADNVLIQPDGKHLITYQDLNRVMAVNSRGRNGIARLYPDGTIDESFDTGIGFDSNIYAIALQPDGKILVGGGFGTFTGPNGSTTRRRIARLNTDGTLDSSFGTELGADGNVRTIVVRSDGKILIGGDFALVNGIARRGVALLNEDGSVDMTFNSSAGLNSGGYVLAAAFQSDNKVVIGGSFTSFSGSARNCIARINADGTLDTGFVVGTGATGGIVAAIALQSSGKILIGGEFNLYNNATAVNVARLNTDGSHDTTFVEGGTCTTNPCTNRNLYNITQITVLIDDRIYMSAKGIQFQFPSQINGYLARFDSNGVRDNGFVAPGITTCACLSAGTVRHAVQSDGKVVTNVYRQLPSGISGYGTYISRFNTNGSLDATYNPIVWQTGGVFDTVIQPGGKVIAVGQFGAANTELRRFIARFNLDGSVDTAFSGQADNAVYNVLIQPDGKILIAGDFGNVNGVARVRIARLNADGTLDTSFQSGANERIYALALQPDGKILIGGMFTLYQGTTVNRIARLNSDGTLDTSFNIGAGFNELNTPEPGVRSIALQPNGQIVVGGNFSTYNGTTRQRIARLNADGTLDANFNPGNGMDAPVEAINILPSGKMLIGGNFTTYNNSPQLRIARIDENGALDATFSNTAQPTGRVNEFYVQSNGKIIIGGVFTTIAGQTRNGIARLNGDGTLDTTFHNNMLGANPLIGYNGIFDTALAVDESSGRVYYGSRFSTFNNVGRASIARLFLNTSAPATVAVTVNTNPAGRSFTVDGTSYTSPQTFNWEPSSQHTIATTSPQAGTTGTQYVWANWSDGGAISHMVTTPNADTTYTANFTTQYQLTMNAAAGGTVSPSSGFYNAGQSVEISATPNSGAIFSGWTGSGNGSYSGTNNPASVTMNEPLTETASFVECSYTLNPAGANVSAGGGNASFAVNAPAGCAWTAASDAAWLTTSSAGSGNGTVNYAVSANAGAARSATVTVGGQTFTVNQIAADGSNDQPILFTSTRDGNIEIYRMNADGTNQQRLTNSPENEGSALWSPDGSKIAFSRTISSSQIQIWMMNSDGSGQTLISDAAGVHVLHGFSPNGQKILFGKRESSAVENLWTMNPDGSGKLQITNAGAIDHIADWSKDGTRIAFGRCTPQFVCDVFTINSDGSNPTNLTPANPNDDDGAQWTPDGRIVFGSQSSPDDYNVYIMNADGSNKQPLTNAVPPLSYSPNQISPAGDKVSMAFRGTTTNDFDISTVKLDGSGLVNLTNNSVFDFFGAWSPDGQKIAFRSRRDAAATDEIYVMNADGSGVVRLTFNTANDTVTDWFRPSAPRRAPFDFDGDGKSDVSIFRPSDGSWWYLQSSDQQFKVYRFGVSTDKIAPGDYTGDGKTDIAVFRDGTWYVQRSEDNSFFSFPFGTTGDIPAPADFDADGKTDAAVYRPSTGTWYISNSGGSGTSIIGFGTPEDKPVPADFDGDGKADIAIFRPSDGSWWYLRSSDSQFRVFRFGVSTDKPVQGDYTGDGKADLAVFRPSTGEWFVQRSEDNSFFSFPWGQAGDIPAPGDYDGDGTTDAAVFRPSNNTWYMNRTSSGVGIVTFGSAGDVPVPTAFVP